MEIITVENIQIELTRKNIKNINLRITKPNGQVKMSVPLFTTKRSAIKFVREKLDWIVQTQNKVIEQAKDRCDIDLLSNNKFETGDKISVWGQVYTLNVLPSKRWKLELNQNNKTAHFYVTENSTVESRRNYLKKYYKEILLEQAIPLFDKWESVTGLAPKKIDVRFTRSNWGSCMKRTGRIMLNGQLATMDPKYLDYVVLHELIHLKHDNHGPQFKEMLTKYMPNWKSIRKEMR